MRLKFMLEAVTPYRSWMEVAFDPIHWLDRHLRPRMWESEYEL